MLFGYQYTYDTAGNISGVTTKPSERDSITQAYTYDAQGQLATEKNGSGTTFGYAYDTAGNIRSITKDGTVTKSFGYTNASWPDLLTSVTANGTTKDVLYEGQSQTSDLPSSGNPVTYYNGRDYHFDWSKGRQLTEAVVGGQTVKYAYDMAGVRSSKQVGDTTYTYTTLSGKVMRQQWDGKTLEFVYDDGSQPFAMIYKHGSETELYYYLVNAQGDVAAILDSSGTMVASYNYGAWGSCTVYNSSDAAIGDLNPLRYRGYYYDAETGFYYLQSRYYDPAICRFINADTFATTDANGFLSANMFAYCENNPIMRTDANGDVWNLVIGAAVGAIAGVAGQVLSDAVTSIANGELTISNWQTYVGALAGGALSGAVLGGTGNVGLANAVSGFTTTGIGAALEKATGASDKSWAEIGVNAVADGMVSYGLGTLPGVKNITRGRNNMSAVYKSGLTKLRKGTAKRMSFKVKRKGLISTFVGGFAMDAYYGLKQHGYNRFRRLFMR